MRPNLANTNKPIEIVQFDVNWWGYKVYTTASGINLVDNGTDYILLATMTI